MLLNNCDAAVMTSKTVQRTGSHLAWRSRWASCVIEDRPSYAAQLMGGEAAADALADSTRARISATFVSGRCSPHARKASAGMNAWCGCVGSRATPTTEGGVDGAPKTGRQRQFALTLVTAVKCLVRRTSTCTFALRG